jgi:hypothetical protein
MYTVIDLILKDQLPVDFEIDPDMLIDLFKEWENHNHIDHKNRQKVYREIRKQQGVIYLYRSPEGKEHTVRHAHGRWSCDCLGYSYRGTCRHIDVWRDYERMRDEKLKSTF